MQRAAWAACTLAIMEAPAEPSVSAGTAPPSSVPNFPVPAASDGFSLTKDDATWAMVAHALTFLEGGLIGPLVLYLVKRDTSSFVAFHALQSFYFGLLFFFVSLCTCGVGALVFLIPYFVYEFLALRAANDGEWYRLPIVGEWAWRKHPGPGGVGGE